MRELIAVVALVALPVVPIAGLTPAAPAAAAEVTAQEPAVELPEEDAAEEPDPWTARYLAPTVLAMAAVVIALVAVYYAFRVRGRYRVVK